MGNDLICLLYLVISVDFWQTAEQSWSWQGQGYHIHHYNHGDFICTQRKNKLKYEWYLQHIPRKECNDNPL